MEITDVSAYALSSPIDPPQERPFYGGIRTLRKRDVVLVAVELSDGEVGYAPAGASSSAMREHFEGATQEGFAKLLSGRVSEALSGRTLSEPSDAHESIEGLGLPEPLCSQAIGAVDVALYDLEGKRRGMPIYELLATEPDARGSVTTDLPLYASAGMYMEPEGYVAQARTIDDLGFFGYKYRPGIGPDADRKTARLLADAIGCELMIDAHTWWKLGDRSYASETVRELADGFSDHGVYWLEEPVPPADHAGYRALADRTAVPLAGGESEETPDGLCALADTGAVSFLQGDVRHHRGFTGCWEAATHCAGTDVTFVPHNFGTWLGLVANAHLVAAAPETELLEYPVFENDPALTPHLAGRSDPGMYPFTLAFDLLEDDLSIVDGRFRVPDGPGLGVTVDESVIEEYPFVEGSWTEFRYD